MFLALPPAWRVRCLWLAGTIGVLIAAYLPTFADMVGLWSHSSTFNHCFLIPPIAVYLGLHCQQQLRGFVPAASRMALLFVFANSLLWVIGELVAVALFQHVAAVGMFIGVAWALIGPRPFRVLLFPFAYLYFCVPEGEFLVPYLQDWTAQVLVYMLRLSNIPVFLDGRYLTIPSGNYVVAEACSGINYLIASVSVSAMFAFLRFRSLARRSLFMLAGVAVPLIANGLRAYGIVMISHLSDHRYAQGIDHFIYGWFFFGIVIFVLFAIGNMFADDDDDMPTAEPQAPATATVWAPSSSSLMVVVLLAALAPRAALHVMDAARATAPQLVLPAAPPGWQGPERLTEFLDGHFNGASQHLVGRYVEQDSGENVILEVHYYRSQSAGAELVNQTNRVFNAKKLQQTAYGRRELPAGALVDAVDEVTVHGKLDDFLIWSWFDVHGARTVTRLAAKLYEARARLSAEASGAAIVAVATRMPDQETAADRLRRFMHAIEPTLGQMAAAGR